MLMDRFFFIPAKYERLKKWNVLYTSVLSLFMNPVVCSFWSIGRKLETDIDASFIADIFFSSMHKMTILILSISKSKKNYPEYEHIQ